MTSSFKQRRQSGAIRKSKHPHNATKVMKSGTSKRGFKTRTLYWDQRSGSWKSTKNKPIGDGLKRDFSNTKYKTKKNYQLSKDKSNNDANEKLKIINKARRDGNAPDFGDIRGTDAPNTNQSSNNDKPKTDNKDNKDNKVVEKKVVEKKEVEKKEVEKKEVKKDPLAKYRRTKGEGVGKGDTRITKKLKKAGFTETRLAKLREKNAAFQKAKKGGKEAMKKYREKYPKRG